MIKYPHNSSEKSGLLGIPEHLSLYQTVSLNRFIFQQIDDVVFQCKLCVSSRIFQSMANYYSNLICLNIMRLREVQIRKKNPV